MTAGFAVGIVVNGYEVYRGVSSNFDMMNTFIDLQPPTTSDGLASLWATSA